MYSLTESAASHPAISEWRDTLPRWHWYNQPPEVAEAFRLLAEHIRDEVVLEKVSHIFGADGPAWDALHGFFLPSCDAASWEIIYDPVFHIIRFKAVIYIKDGIGWRKSAVSEVIGVDVLISRGLDGYLFNLVKRLHVEKPESETEMPEATETETITKPINEPTIEEWPVAA